MLLLLLLLLPWAGAGGATFGVDGGSGCAGACSSVQGKLVVLCMVLRAVLFLVLSLCGLTVVLFVSKRRAVVQAASGGSCASCPPLTRGAVCAA